MSFVQQSSSKWSRLGLLVIFSFCAFSFSGLATKQAAAQNTLSIGSKAPDLDIAHWLSNRGGDFSEVTEFEDGKVYVVEFWATWCGPCISAMPHIVEMQNEYADKDVQFISVSTEDLPTIIKFLVKNVRGTKKQNYAKLTSAYSLTSDPDGSVNADYMTASGQRGIPTAFIVGKTGLIEWIGHPMTMDKPLGQIVADEWNREFEIMVAEVSKLMRKDDVEGAISKLDLFMEDVEEGTEVHERGSMIRLSLVLEAGGPEAAAAFKTLADKSKDPQAINEMAWGIVEKVQGGADVEPEVLKAACDAAKRAVELVKETKDKEGTAMVLDTHSNLLFLCDKLDEAIAVQEEAVELSDEKELADFL